MKSREDADCLLCDGTRVRPRGLRAINILGGRRAHGTRLRYLSGCYCLDCRKANSSYAAARMRAIKDGEWNGIVDATPAREHIRKLARVGVGYKIVASCTDLSTGIVAGIKSGRRPRARALTVRKILAVTSACKADHALVSAGGTWRKIRTLQDEGYTLAAIAHLLGCKRGALQLGKNRITLRSRSKVDRLYRKIMLID